MGFSFTRTLIRAAKTRTSAQAASKLESIQLNSPLLQSTNGVAVMSPSELSAQRRI